MKKIIGLFAAFLLTMSFSVCVWATTIDLNGSSISFGSSWDGNPPGNIDNLLSVIPGSLNLTLVNGISNEIETWQGASVTAVLLGEFAGYSIATTFGLYADGGGSQEIFSGSDSAGSFSSSIDVSSFTSFGFYIDPNGVTGNRMYSEHGLNGGDYQVAIFRVEEFANTYILGWEDLPLQGGDADYQDMIVAIHVASTPIPAPIFLLGTGLLGLWGVKRKNGSKAFV